MYKVGILKCTNTTQEILLEVCGLTNLRKLNDCVSFDRSYNGNKTWSMGVGVNKTNDLTGDPIGAGLHGSINLLRYKLGMAGP